MRIPGSGRAVGLAIAIGLILAAKGVAPAGPKETGASDVVIVGFLEIKRKAVAEDTFVLRVATHNPVVSVILAEQEIQPGKFRVSFPAPADKDRALVVVTSNHHQPLFHVLEPRARSLLIRKPFRPKPWVRGTIRVVRGGQAVEDALVTWSPRPWGLTFLHQQVRTSPQGTAEINAVAGESLLVRAEDGRDTGLEKIEVRGSIDDPIRLRLRRHDRSVLLRLGKTDPETVTVRARTGEEWVVVPRWESREWRGEMPEGTTALRIECPGMRPLIILDPKPDHNGKYQYRPSLRSVDAPVVVVGYSRLIVKQWHRKPLDMPERRLGLGCGGCVGRPDRVPDWAQVRKAGEDVDSWGGFRSLRDDMDVDAIYADLEPGAYRVRIRGELGLPRGVTVELPADADVMTWVEMGGGSSILLTVLDEKGTACPRVSFRVIDAQGRPARVVYVPAAGGSLPADPEREWARAWFSDRLTNVPGKGEIRLEPGSWRLELRRGDGDPQIVPVRTYAEMTTRVDVSPPKE